MIFKLKKNPSTRSTPSVSFTLCDDLLLKLGKHLQPTYINIKSQSLYKRIIRLNNVHYRTAKRAKIHFQFDDTYHALIIAAECIQKNTDSMTKAF